VIGLKPITPKNMGGMFKALPNAVKKGMRQAAEKMLEDFEQTTKTWQRPVTFAIEPVGEYDLAVGTNDEIWRYVDEGTKAHTITPRGRFLRFSPGGTPKTRPGVLTSTSGRAGSGTVYARQVHHPGSAPRDFTGQIQKRWTRGVQPFIRAAIEEALP
jgi:hypothetical protein